MDKDYFNSLMNSVQNSERPVEKSLNVSGQAFLTVKVDIDCKLYCDGDFLDLFEANKVKKIPIETGQHLITIESEHCDGVSEDHVIDAAGAGKNYLLLVNDLKQKEKEKTILEQQTEAYVALSDNNKTLTFYFDNQKESRKGMDLNQFDYESHENTCSDHVNVINRSAIKTVIFDDSFSNCHSIYTTKCWFENMNEMTSIKGLHNLNTENVMDMSGMFRFCCSLQELDLSNFDTRNVTNMSFMFCECSALLKVDLSNFDTRNVTDMRAMFLECSALPKVDLSNFDTRNVTDMKCMFSECSSLKELDIREGNKDIVFDGVNTNIIIKK